MNRTEIEQHVGFYVTINGRNDLGIYSELRRFINSPSELRVIKLTRAGMAYLEAYDGTLISVPPSNCDPVNTMEDDGNWIHDLDMGDR